MFLVKAVNIYDFFGKYPRTTYILYRIDRFKFIKQNFIYNTRIMRYTYI